MLYKAVSSLNTIQLQIVTENEGRKKNLLHSFEYLHNHLTVSGMKSCFAVK